MISRARAFLFIAFIFFQANVKAQISYDISGYVSDIASLQATDEGLARQFGIEDNISGLNLARLRLRPAVYLGQASRIHMEYEISALYNSAGSFIPVTSYGRAQRQLVDMAWGVIDEKNFTAGHLIDRLYYRQGFDNAEVRIGRQRIAWGSGRIWNPTDLFNPINPANFYKLEKDGADAAMLSWYLGRFTDIEAVYNPVENFNGYNFGGRFRTNYAGYDLSVIAGRFEERIVAGWDIAGNFFDAGIRTEGIFSVSEDDAGDNFVSLIAGIDNQFTPELYLLAEYHYNGEGKKERAEYELFRLLSGDILNLARHYVYAGGSYLLTPLLTLNFGGNLNLTDNSGYINLSGNYSLTEDVYLTFGSQVTFGESFSEYWYYPDSFYAKADYYF